MLFCVCWGSFSLGTTVTYSSTPSTPPPRLTPHTSCVSAVFCDSALPHPYPWGASPHQITSPNHLTKSSVPRSLTSTETTPTVIFHIFSRHQYSLPAVCPKSQVFKKTCRKHTNSWWLWFYLRLSERYPSKHETLSQCWYNAGPPASIMAQHCTDIGWALLTGCHVLGWLDGGIIEPSKHETFTQCWFYVGPASQTLDQHKTNIGSTCHVCWEAACFSSCCRHISPVCSYPQWRFFVLLVIASFHLTSSPGAILWGSLDLTLSPTAIERIIPDNGSTQIQVHMKIIIRNVNSLPKMFTTLFPGNRF